MIIVVKLIFKILSFITLLNSNVILQWLLISISLPLSNLQIPISWPLISSYIGNNYFEYILNGITYNYTIPDGSYSATDLKTLFNSNISLVVSYNKNNGKFTFTHTTYEFTITNNTTCYYEIGFLNNNYTSSALTLSSINPIDLSETRKIYVRSNITTKNIRIE